MIFNQSAFSLMFALTIFLLSGVCTSTNQEIKVQDSKLRDFFSVSLHKRRNVRSRQVPTSKLGLYDEQRGVKMGVPDGGCDDAKTRLDVDWNGSKVNHTCYWPKKPIYPNKSKQSRLRCETLPESYYPQHHCMNEKLNYIDDVPTYGDHRPLWPKFGEYIFVPPQRWLHNIEHGSVVMLYHPCAHHALVDELRNVVKKCIRKHVITPYDKLSYERPVALVAWGCKLEMAFINRHEVIEFIKQKGMKGPEGEYSKQGQYDFGLLELAQPIPGSDIDDSVLCPNL